MFDNHLYEDISLEEYEEAMAGFEEWADEVEEEEIDFDEWERCFLADLEKNG